MLACWGAFLGLIPPVFLMDEVEGLDPKYMLYGFALGLVGLMVPIYHGPERDSDDCQGLVRPGAWTCIA